MVPEYTNDITDQNDILNHDWCQVSVFGNVNCEVEHDDGKSLDKSYVNEWFVENLSWDWGLNEKIWNACHKHTDDWLMMNNFWNWWVTVFCCCDTIWPEKCC